ncbi:MAG: hypothetical protein H7X78_02970 [Methyloceanibacter sp.]|nr:hypothetical protein [Methyloceanibacter sp.]
MLTVINAIHVFGPLHAAWMWGLEHDLPQGWATLLGAIIGLGVIAWQARTGFRHLIRSQEHQANLQRELDKESHRREAAVLAAALRGELLAGAYALVRRSGWLEAIEKIIDDAAKNPQGKFYSEIRIEGVTTPIYDAQASRLGLIGASLAADVAQVYGSIKSQFLLAASEAGRDPKLAKEFVEVQLNLSKVFSKDVLHVCKRLLAFETGTPEDDPGILVEARKVWLIPSPRGTSLTFVYPLWNFAAMQTLEERAVLVLAVSGDSYPIRTVTSYNWPPALEEHHGGRAYCGSRPL